MVEVKRYPPLPFICLHSVTYKHNMTPNRGGVCLAELWDKLGLQQLKVSQIDRPKNRPRPDIRNLQLTAGEAQTWHDLAVASWRK